jgi:hypothetical protein
MNSSFSKTKFGLDPKLALSMIYSTVNEEYHKAYFACHQPNQSLNVVSMLSCVNDNDYSLHSFYRRNVIIDSIFFHHQIIEISNLFITLVSLFAALCPKGHNFAK